MNYEDARDYLSKLNPPMLQGWSIDSIIGEGRYGIVFSISRPGATERSTRESSALKWIRLYPSENESDNSQRGILQEGLKERYTKLKEQCVQEIEIIKNQSAESELVAYHDWAVFPHTDNIGWNILIRMEKLTPLKRHIVQDGLSEREVANIGSSIAKALQICHENGIVHGDVKIENCYYSRGKTYKLGDFGLSFKEGTGRLGGTAGYIAPECIGNTCRSPQSDQYALGVMLFSLLNDMVVPSSISETEKMPIHCHNQRFWQIIHKALNLDPQKRYNNISDLQSQLEILSNKLDTTCWFPSVDVGSKLGKQIETPKSSTKSDLINKATQKDKNDSADKIASAESETADSNSPHTQESTSFPGTSVTEELEERIKRARNKKRKRVIRNSLIVTFILLFLIGAGFLILKPAKDKFTQAKIELKNGNYSTAATIFDQIIDHADSSNWRDYCLGLQNIQEANVLESTGHKGDAQKKIEDTITLFLSLSNADFEDSKGLYTYCTARLNELTGAKQAAEDLYGSMNPILDSKERLQNIRNGVSIPTEIPVQVLPTLLPSIRATVSKKKTAYLGPGLNYDVFDVMAIYETTDFTICGKTRDWYLIETSIDEEKIRLWISSALINHIDKSTEPQLNEAGKKSAVKTSSPLYYGPGTDYKKHDLEIKSGTKVTVFSREDIYSMIEVVNITTGKPFRAWILSDSLI